MNKSNTPLPGRAHKTIRNMDPVLWRKMILSTQRQGIDTWRWLEEAIKAKLALEKHQS